MKYYFAPLQGFTDSVYREVHSKHFSGLDAYLTPFCRVEKGEMRWHDQKDVNPERNENLSKTGRLIPQVIGNTAEEVDLLVSKLKSLGYRSVDINFGCPFPMIAKKQKGAGILLCPDKVKDVLSVVKLHPDISFSVKMRLGMTDPLECMEILPYLNEAGLKQITMHARLGKDQYKGDLDLLSFDKFRNACLVPLVYNGDIIDENSCRKIVEQYPNLQGVMIGRGLLQNPFLVEELIAGAAIPCAEKSKRLKKFVSDLTEGYSAVMNGGELQLVQKLTLFWEYLLPELDHRSRKKILKSKKLTDYNSNVAEALSAYGRGDRI